MLYVLLAVSLAVEAETRARLGLSNHGQEDPG